MGITHKQRKLVARKIRLQVNEQKRIRKKFSKGNPITQREFRTAKRTKKQVVAIAFSEARKEDPSIPRNVRKI